MNSIIKFLMYIFLFEKCHGVVYYLNETQIKRMPPIYTLDDYESCLQTASDVYCSVSFNLVSDQHSDLLRLIQEYSKHYVRHFNYTKLRHGICLKNHCPHINKTAVSGYLLEECLNESLWYDYELKTKVENYHCYDTSDNHGKVDISDVIVGIAILIIIALNFFGSLYEVYDKSNKFEDKSFLLCFSIQRNWKRLTSSTKNLDTRSERLKGLNGFRCIIMYGVIIVHCFWPYLIAASNPYAVEQAYYNIVSHIFLNGSVAIQTYLVISGFLLAYNIEMKLERHAMDWRTVPKGILLRYLRLTPAYVVVMVLNATWFKFGGPTGLWQVAAQTAIDDCKTHWWLNLLYLNNYIYNSQCMLQAWYLAVDMQLFCLGLIVCVWLRNSRYRRSFLLALFIVGIIFTFVHTYVRDLEALMLIIPGEARYLFEVEPTFNESYKMGHTNIPSYIIGIGLACLVHKLQHKEFNSERLKKYRIFYWALLPTAFGLILSGMFFYRDVPRDPTYIRAIYSTVTRPLFGFVMALFIFGLIFRIENTYRGIFEWQAWTVPSKLSYGVFLIHFTYLRLFVATQANLLYFSNFNMILLATCLTLLSLLSAIPLWLLVEAPFTELTKHFTKAPPKKEKEMLNEYHETIENDTYI